jgi:polysaccharide biosynthesis protein PslG
MPKIAGVSRRVLVAGVAAAALAAAIGSAGGATSARAAAPRAPGRTPVPAGFVGMVMDEPVWPNPYVALPSQLDTMVSSGVESIRVVFDWSQMQPYRDWSEVPADQQSQFVDVGGIPTNFTTADTLLGLAAARGMTVLPVVQNAPAWDGQNYPGGIVTLARSTGPYAAFVGGLVRRYGSRGSFWRSNPQIPKLPIEMWQIWNEPNIPAFWPQQPYYSRYVALLRAAHAAIKAADPRAKVVLAGLPNYSWTELARIYEFRGARKLFDLVAVHPYTKQPQGVITILGYVRREMDLAGDASKPILADEISWPSSLGQTTHNVGYDFATTEAGQAQNLGQLLPMLVRDRFRLGLAGFYYYDWAGLERPNYLAFDFSGLFKLTDGAFVAKPAYAVFRREALAMEGCRAKLGRVSVCRR